jgi:hypothetical protein
MEHALSMFQSEKWSLTLLEHDEEESFQEQDNETSTTTTTSNNTSKKPKKMSPTRMRKIVREQIVQPAYVQFLDNSGCMLRTNDWCFYPYFINVELLGVFNTLIGSYMQTVPLLYFNTAKQHLWSANKHDNFMVGLKQKEQGFTALDGRFIDLTDEPEPSENINKPIPRANSTVPTTPRPRVGGNNNNAASSLNLERSNRVRLRSVIDLERMRLSNAAWSAYGTAQAEAVQVFMLNATEFGFLSVIIPGLFNLDSLTLAINREIKTLYEYMHRLLFKHQSYSLRLILSNYDGPTVEQIQDRLANDLYGIMPLILHYRLNLVSVMNFARFMMHDMFLIKGTANFDCLCARLRSDAQKFSDPPTMQGDWNVNLLGTVENFWSDVVRLFEHEFGEFIETSLFKRCFVLSYCTLIICKDATATAGIKSNRSIVERLVQRFPPKVANESKRGTFRMFVPGEYKYSQKYNMNNTFILDQGTNVAAFYMQENQKNNSRAMSMLLRKHLEYTSNPFSSIMTEMLAMFAGMCNFDALMLIEFLKQQSRINNPGSDRRSVLVVTGPKECGKSKLLHLHERMHGKSVYSTTDLFPSQTGSKGAAPDPGSIAAMSSYLNSSSEIRSINVQTLKQWTGSDTRQMRELYSNVMCSFRAFAFYFVVANRVPKLHGEVDEATRERLCTFQLENGILSVSDRDMLLEREKVSNLNPFYFLAHKHCLLISGNLDIESQIPVLGNLLY